MFAINETPYTCWDWDLKKKNLEFLEGVDADYFEYVAEVNAPHLKSDDNHRAALSIRLAYSQGLETLFALLCSMIQAPQCVIGWMLSYKNVELKQIVEKISRGKDVYSRLRDRRTTWGLLAKHVHSRMPYEPEKKEWIQEGFGRAWARFAREFVDEKMTQEYNSGKHGLRTRHGGFSLQVGLEETPGVPAPPENMTTIGGSVYGTSYFTVVRIIDNQRLNFRPRRQARNWNPENLINGLVLLSMSINNVVSFLKILNGVPGVKCKFLNPSAKDEFDDPWKNSVGVSESNMDTVVNPSDIRPCSKDEVIESYNEPPDDPS